jgi:hypothetical protein
MLSVNWALLISGLIIGGSTVAGHQTKPNQTVDKGTPIQLQTIVLSKMKRKTL